MTHGWLPEGFENQDVAAPGRVAGRVAVRIEGHRRRVKILRGGMALTALALLLGAAPALWKTLRETPSHPRARQVAQPAREGPTTPRGHRKGMEPTRQRANDPREMEPRSPRANEPTRERIPRPPYLQFATSQFAIPVPQFAIRNRNSQFFPTSPLRSPAGAWSWPGRAIPGRIRGLPLHVPQVRPVLHRRRRQGHPVEDDGTRIRARRVLSSRTESVNTHFGFWIWDLGKKGPWRQFRIWDSALGLKGPNQEDKRN